MSLGLQPAGSATVRPHQYGDSAAAGGEPVQLRVFVSLRQFQKLVEGIVLRRLMFSVSVLMACNSHLARVFAIRCSQDAARSVTC
jgi:hypothetical protein